VDPDLQHCRWQPAAAGAACASEDVSLVPRIAQFGLKLTADGKIKLGLSETKGVVVVVDQNELKELKPELELDLKAGSHRVTVLVTRDAGELKTFRVELLDGAAVLE